MSYVAERREEEKERRRGEIIDAAERQYAEKGWDAVTMDQVARAARLSRALVYVYFKDKDDLMFAIGERAMHLLRTRFEEAFARHELGIDKVEAIGRSYMAYAHEFPHYFDVCARFHAHSVALDPSSNEGACAVAGDEVLGVVIRAIESGVADGSIRTDVGDPGLLAVTLWGCTHGVTQIAMNKGSDLAQLGITANQMNQYTVELLRTAMIRKEP
jgi:AcrR family transcriptional regulator